MTGSNINRKTRYRTPLTSNGGGRQHHGLEPHRKEVYDRVVTKCDQEIADSNEDGDFLFEEKRCKHRLDDDFQFNDNEQEEKHDGDHKS